MTNYTSRRSTHISKSIVKVDAGATVEAYPDPQDSRQLLVEFDNGGVQVLGRTWAADWEEVKPEPEPEPVEPTTYSISTDRESVQQGQPVYITMKFTGVGGAWLVTGGKETALAGPVANVTDYPQATTTYTLKVMLNGGGYANVSKTVAVTPKPQPISTKAGIGVHILTNVRGWELAYSRGCRVGLFMNRPDEACQYARIDPLTWTPDSNECLIMYRIFHEPNPWSSDDMVAQLAGLTDNPNPNKKNVIITLANEWDNGVEGAGNSAAGMARFCDWTIECVQKLRAKGFRHIAWLTSSMGTPDFTNPDLCNVIRQKIAPLWNNGTILWTDMHLYSPDPGWIYKGMAKDASMLGLEPHVIRAQVGRDNHTAIWVDYAPQGQTLENWNPAAKQIATFNDAPTAQWWFEERWRFLYTRCGFLPTAPGRIVSSEMGLDEGGIGGYPAHNMSREQVVAHLRRFMELQQQPLVVNGQSYPSPFVAGAVFQGDPDDGRWQGYRCTGFYPLPWRL